MRLTLDTNILLRLALQDDLDQARVALEAVLDADELFVPVPVLCEFVWVARSVYRRTRAQIAASIRTLIRDHALVVDRTAVAAGLAMLDAGGDFADGAIAASGQEMGGEVFASFDRDAADKLDKAGYPVLVLTGG